MTSITTCTYDTYIPATYTVTQSNKAAIVSEKSISDTYNNTISTTAATTATTSSSSLVSHSYSLSAPEVSLPTSLERTDVTLFHDVSDVHDTDDLEDVELSEEETTVVAGDGFPVNLIDPRDNKFRDFAGLPPLSEELPYYDYLFQ